MVNFASAPAPTAASDSGCIWLNSESVRNRVDTKALLPKQTLPVFSISSIGYSLLFAGDNEALFFIPQVDFN